jgi:hypothetical protein
MSAEAEKKPSVVRLILAIGLIVLGAVVVWAVSANWRRFEARYWIWKAARTQEWNAPYGVAAEAHKRGFCLLRLYILGVDAGDTKEGSLRIYVSYRPLARDIFFYHWVLISADGGKTWRKESTTQEARDKSGPSDPDYEIRYERDGFSVWRADRGAWTLVREFAGYPELRVFDIAKFGLIPPEPEAPR